MTVFLGQNGRVTLRRKGIDEAWRTVVNEADVRENVRRFSVDFAHQQFITGDHVEIRTVDGSDLTWIDDPAADNSFTRFVNINAAGGIRLYDTFTKAIKGDLDDAIVLKQPVLDQECLIQVVPGQDQHCLADVTSFQITTSRDTIDTTNLGDYYRKQYESGLVQGQGQIECLWRAPKRCDDLEERGTSPEDLEFSSYLARLCIRLVQGAAFHGWFYVYADEDGITRSVWYESDTCIVTNVAVTVSPTQAIETTIDFVTSGPIELREGYIPVYLELEQDEFDVELEEDPGGLVELDGDD